MEIPRLILHINLSWHQYAKRSMSKDTCILPWDVRWSVSVTRVHEIERKVRIFYWMKNKIWDNWMKKHF